MSESKQDTIKIEGLRLSTQIGVPDEERAGWQSLTAHLTLTPIHGFSDAGDDIAKTVDYDTVARQIRSLASENPRKLIETLAEEIAELLLGKFPLQSVELELRKYILPDCDYVAVSITRSAA